MAAEEERATTPGPVATADPAHPSAQPARHSWAGEPDPPRLAGLLLGASLDWAARSGRRAPATPPGAAAQAGETARVRGGVADRRRWSNRWFAAPGLFRLEQGSCTYGEARGRPHGPESRRREIRPSSSEAGERLKPALPTPIHAEPRWGKARPAIAAGRERRHPCRALRGA